MTTDTDRTPELSEADLDEIEDAIGDPLDALLYGHTLSGDIDGARLALGRLLVAYRAARTERDRLRLCIDRAHVALCGIYSGLVLPLGAGNAIDDALEALHEAQNGAAATTPTTALHNPATVATGPRRCDYCDGTGTVDWVGADNTDVGEQDCRQCGGSGLAL